MLHSSPLGLTLLEEEEEYGKQRRPTELDWSFGCKSVVQLVDFALVVIVLVALLL